MKILVLDNYDSFTYNLVHLIKELAPDDEVDVFRNDRISLEEVDQYDKIILSPGPGVPKDAGIMEDLIRTYGSRKSIFGVCLGFQAIAEVYGASLVNLDKVYHGITTPIEIVDKKDKSFQWLDDGIEVGRYHSWGVDPQKVSSDFAVSAVDREGNIMALYHRKYDVRGVQFHPESVLTPSGKQIIANILR